MFNQHTGLLLLLNFRNGVHPEIERTRLGCQAPNMAVHRGGTDVQRLTQFFHRPVALAVVLPIHLLLLASTHSDFFSLT